MAEAKRIGATQMISLVGGWECDEFDKADLTSVQFPSDNLSIGTLRQEHPALFDIGFGQGLASQPLFFFASSKPGHVCDTLAEMLFCERLLALNAYAKAAGIVPTDYPRQELISALTPLYVRYGIASGEHHARILIDEIEEQARKLGVGRSK